ncbi:MAG: hypothetical protein GXP56_16585 [Deltaproteobacteria bacterium]|nr:hypothetical protein [Deltaproteobacteria bacterium]
MNSEIDKLLKAANETESVELKIFQNAVIKNLKIFQESPTRANKKNLDSARDGLNQKKQEIEQKYFSSQENVPCFPSLLAAMEHLDKAGYKISKSKIYRDKDKNFIKVNADGSIPEVEIRAYAGTLERKIGKIDDLNDIHNRKTSKEIERLDEQIAKLRFEREKDQGRYVPKAEVDQKIISTLIILDVSFRQIMDMNMSDICHILGGDVKKLNSAKDYVDDLLYEMMNKLARTDSFSIKIEELNV